MTSLGIRTSPKEGHLAGISIANTVQPTGVSIVSIFASTSTVGSIVNTRGCAGLLGICYASCLHVASHHLVHVAISHVICRTETRPDVGVLQAGMLH